MVSWVQFPDRRPRILRDKLVLAWIAYHSEARRAMGKEPECHLSLRNAVMNFGFSSKSNVEKCFKRLKRSRSRTESGWIVVSTPAVGTKGHHYKLGRRAEADLEKWEKVGRMLFGPKGVLRRYRVRPVFTGKGLGPEGCCVMACVESCGPATRVEIVKLLDSYVSRTTVHKHLRLLVANGLVKEQDGAFTTPWDLPNAVERLEEAYDLVEQHYAHHRRLREESAEYQKSVLGDVSLGTLMADLRELPCFYCKSPPTANNGHVEHFPPKNWGGDDTRSMLLPACPGCNLSHGPLIAMSDCNAFLDDPIPIRFVDDMTANEFRTWIVEAMMIRASDYGAAMNDRNVKKATHLVEGDFHIQLWAALRLGPAYLELVSPTTGQFAVFEDSHRSADIREHLGQYEGLAEMLVPRPPTAR